MQSWCSWVMAICIAAEATGAMAGPRPSWTCVLTAFVRLIHTWHAQNGWLRIWQTGFCTFIFNKPFGLICSGNGKGERVPFSSPAKGTEMTWFWLILSVRWASAVAPPHQRHCLMDGFALACFTEYGNSNGFPEGLGRKVHLEKLVNDKVIDL